MYTPRIKRVLILVRISTNSLVFKLMSSGVTSWFDELSGWHGEETMWDLIHEAHALVVTPGFYGHSLQLLHKLRGAHRAVSPGFVENHAYSPSVDLLEGVLVLLEPGIPYRGAILQAAAGDGTVGSLTRFTRTVLQVPGDEVKGGVGLLGNLADLVVPFQVVTDGDAEVFGGGHYLEDAATEVI